MDMNDCFPVGAVVPYAGPLASSDSGDGVNLDQIRTNLARAGWLFCNGASLNRQDYPELFGVIGQAYGYKDADHFNLPDLRGRFIRGVSADSSTDPDKDSRKASSSDGKGAVGNRVGTLQADAFQGHEHHYTALVQKGPPAVGEGTPGWILDPAPKTTADIVEDTSPDYDTPRTAKETRPVNLYLNHIIRYRYRIHHRG
ncbi:tail fiber protein [Pseudomonas gingeri]|uniref:Tail fiber protein n=2 Tax=Pseudomonas gingeri TaxID=117681 RepID=A0A7Y7XUF6_9PSED|nr:phage tail protein [Pseudomonas gingeri]NVZ28343.1 tail fiber protein [Pseudomonas gingeri]NVZ61954.1 tail fiber protein [Pseudomonas gingeri]NVZ73954.1 tail fiber protein [Pseudomonas gingeri]NWC12291.1 tail fiber protein [Pseudomonas gingeri]NWE47640.1 tail fiber protein [Pseudomonas gingeri]